MMNKQIFLDKTLPDSFKNKVRRDTIFESLLQGTWLYAFRYNYEIGGRSKNQKLINLLIAIDRWLKRFFL